MSKGRFSVCQFFPTGQSEDVRRNVSAEEAMEAFNHYTHNVASRVGITKRVIIIDSNGCINMEWEFDKGVTFPTQEDLRQLNEGED